MALNIRRWMRAARELARQAAQAPSALVFSLSQAKSASSALRKRPDQPTTTRRPRHNPPRAARHTVSAR